MVPFLADPIWPDSAFKLKDIHAMWFFELLLEGGMGGGGGVDGTPVEQVIIDMMKNKQRWE